MPLSTKSLLSVSKSPHEGVELNEDTQRANYTTLISQACSSHCFDLSRSIFTLDDSAIAINLSELLDASLED